MSLSTGAAPQPYHVYDGHGLLLVGTCAAETLTPLFADQDVHPVLTASGEGILILFICDFRDANHGPHQEFQITALTAPNFGERISDDPAEALAGLAVHKDWGVLSLHLWNDAKNVVAYNTEYLGLQAALATGGMTVSPAHVNFAFTGADGFGLIEGQVRQPKRSDAGLMWRVLRHLGVAGLWDAVRRKPSVAHVINRKSDVISRNGRAKTRTAADRLIVTAFDPERDMLDLCDGPLANYRFEPKIFQNVSPFRFIYQHPDAS